MAHYDSPSPKRTTLWSNNKTIGGFWKGKLTKQDKEEMKRKHPSFKTVVKYHDKSGQPRYHGSRQLRTTQSLIEFHVSKAALRTYTKKFAKKMSDLYPKMLNSMKPCRLDGHEDELIAAFRFGGLGDT